MYCVCLWGQQAGNSGVGGRERLAEALRARLVRRCNPANHGSAWWICISVNHLVQGDVNQVNSENPCYSRPGQTKDLASKHEVYCSALWSYPSCGIEHSDPVLYVSVLLYLE